ncbi:hypothetical protein TCAL_14435 [Tigriopus californicus]|uniref:Uncharacterized protein n=1 Tax=Tigriopus californicus TaxID=6832 RepID=A0A553PLS5_TIGCA|nr:hypothetical protein TCAL_14435 [Tigriopus californicus]
MVTRVTQKDFIPRLAGLAAVLTPNASVSPSTTPISTPVASPVASPWGEVAPGSSPNHPPTGTPQSQAAKSNPNNNSLSHCHVIQSG